jgi:hypothetical protein
MGAARRNISSVSQPTSETRLTSRPAESARPPQKTLPGIAPGGTHAHSMVVPTSHAARAVALPAMRTPSLPKAESITDDRAERRVRVSVRVSARDPDLLVVRKLDDGAPVPMGAREAFLVLSFGSDE